LGMSSGIGVGSTYSLLDRAPGWKVFMVNTGVIRKEVSLGRVVRFGK